MAIVTGDWTAFQTFWDYTPTNDGINYTGNPSTGTKEWLFKSYLSANDTNTAATNVQGLINFSGEGRTPFLILANPVSPPPDGCVIVGIQVGLWRGSFHNFSTDLTDRLVQLLSPLPQGSNPEPYLIGTNHYDPTPSGTGQNFVGWYNTSSGELEHNYGGASDNWDVSNAQRFTISKFGGVCVQGRCNRVGTTGVQFRLQYARIRFTYDSSRTSGKIFLTN